MNILKDFKLVNHETQVGKAGCFEYEIYGQFSGSGIIFERDLQNPCYILSHITDGVKIVSSYLDENDSFFKKGEDSFYMHYRDCDDYKYSKEPVSLLASDIVKLIKRYVYLYHPKLETGTAVGWDRVQGELRNPNTYDGTVKLDDGEYYYITKHMELVEISLIKDMKLGITKSNLEPTAYFKLDASMYQVALDFRAIKDKVRRTLYNKLEDGALLECMRLKHELEAYVNAE